MISRNYNKLLTAVAKSFVNNFNIQWQRPFDITSLDPQTLMFLSNMFVELHVTPMYLDEFYYVGFSYMLDDAPQTYSSL
jgi:hypothetical protein